MNKNMVLGTLLFFLMFPLWGQTSSVNSSDFILEGTVLVEYRGTDRSVNIPASLGITEIGDEVFNEQVRVVVIPEGVRKIRSSFFNCYELSRVVLPSSLTEIGDYAFSGCERLTDIIIPPRVTSIGNGAFFECKSLASIDIPFGVTSIGARTFYECGSLTKVSLPAGLRSIGSRAFFGCTSLKEVTIPSGITLIENGTFAWCRNLTSVNIPAGVTVIKLHAFLNCSALGSIIIPNTVRTIEDEAFYACENLLRVHIPANITSIGLGVFGRCTGLREITVDPGNPIFSSIDGVLFDKYMTVLIEYPAGKQAIVYTIPDGVKQIGDFAFSGSINLLSIAISDDVQFIGTRAFEWCQGLRTAVVPRITRYNADAFPEATEIIRKD
ncbi:MAG: leucine-rich repeat domain-containing protein [Treponema sp.]|jgi:hypothetical protein|nr:leucine-rich repeat domain-containing protein [Treponema sp.]